MLKLKICGLKFPSNIQEISLLNPDYLGFIFYEKSKRLVDEATFEAIHQIDSSKKVAVFVNQSLENILEIAQKGNFKILQLHGDESPEFCKKLKEKEDFQLIKAFGVDENFDFQILKNYANTVDYFLFDTKGKERGGNGTTFDWNILKKYDQTTPFFLSGGIGLDNLDDLMRFLNENTLNIHAIDVNSRFEIAPALKDIEKIKQLVLFLSNKY